MDDVSGFLRRWHALVRRHATADETGRAALVRQVLRDGLDDAAADPGSEPGSEAGTGGPQVDPEDQLTCERDLIASSGLFEEFGYFWHNPDLRWSLCGHDEELRHFVRHGWRRLRHPSATFDLWWYWLTYLDPASEEVNPLVHYLAEGRHRGHQTLPPVQPVRDIAATPVRAPRRVCLFAGYDADGIVDETVVDYLRDLSRFADVYYLADCALEAGELDKLAPYTAGRWAIRHGRYDFGSYSMLARDLVGWETIEGYDELILANDSCYRVQPFDRVFAAMDRVPAHWWGLQATYHEFRVGDFQRLGRPLDLDETLDRLRAGDVWDYSDFHVGSYFVVLRSEVIGDPEFRRRLDTVASQREKSRIVLKYEIGVSRYLVLAGYRLATFVDGVLPFHPVYRASAFGLLGQGFPLFKRALLAENPLDTPDLVEWKQRVLAEAPDAAVETMERNLLRVSPPYVLQRSFGVRTRADGTVTMPEAAGPDTFEEEERWAPRFDHWWAFPVDPVTHRLQGNVRAVFEAVRHDASIKKLLLQHDRSPKLGGDNVVTVALDSPEGQYYLMRAGSIVVSRGPRADIEHPLSADHHRFLDVGHTSAMLRFGAAEPVTDGEDGVTSFHERLHDLDLTLAVCASSSAQAKALKPSVSSPFRPKLWVTGSPRTDLLVGPDETLPADLLRQTQALRAVVGGRRLVVWLPADRGPDRAPPGLAPADVSWLADWAERSDAVLGFRPPAHRAGEDVEALIGAGFLDLSARRYPDVEPVLRVAAALVSDHTTELIDFLVLDRPVVAYVPDLAETQGRPGLLHDLDKVLPGRVCRDGSTLRAALGGLFDEATPEQAAERAAVRDRLHASRDGRTAARLVRRVQKTYLPIAEWLAGA